MIGEDKLNTVIQFAVAEVVLNPDLILGPLRDLQTTRAHEEVERRDSVQEIDYEKLKLENEEQRVLDAYRTGIVSPSQLKPQLEKLNARRNSLELRLEAIQSQQLISLEQAEETVSDYCAEAAKNLANFTAEQWREFLRTVIQSIEFQGDRVTIHGRIPIQENGTGSQVLFERSPPISAV